MPTDPKKGALPCAPHRKLITPKGLVGGEACLAPYSTFRMAKEYMRALYALAMGEEEA